MDIKYYKKNLFTLILKVERNNGRYVLREIKSGEVVNEKIWSRDKKIAFEDNLYLARKKTASGNMIWRKLKPEDVPANYVSPLVSPNEKVADISNSKIVEKTDMTDSEIRVLIKNSYQRKPDLLVIDELNWKLGFRAFLRGENILILGDSGSGKTMTAAGLAESLNRPLFRFNMGNMQDAVSGLIGNTHYKKDEGTFFAESDFIRAITTPYAAILLDEFTRLTPDAENILMSVLDRDQRYLRIDQDEKTPVIKVAKGVTFIGTANVGSEYTSTRIIDRATKDRFSTIIEVPNLDEDQETELMKKKYPELNLNYIKAFAAIASHTRKEIEKSDNPLVSTIISTRSVHAQAELSLDGFYFSEVMEALVLPMYDKEGGLDSERSAMRQLVQKYSNLDNESPLKSERVEKKDKEDYLLTEDDVNI